MNLDHQQFVSQTGTAALTLCTVASDRLGVQAFADWLDIVAVA